jgi:hypothetical protein
MEGDVVVDEKKKNSCGVKKRMVCIKRDQVLFKKSLCYVA